jgi:hypothetical protein
VARSRVADGAGAVGVTCESSRDTLPSAKDIRYADLLRHLLCESTKYCITSTQLESRRSQVGKFFII